MKAITIWQPWAEFVAAGVKHNETRSWATKYRGPIAIHAAVKPIRQVVPLLSEKAFGLMVEKLEKASMANGELLTYFNYGEVIATAELVACHLITEDNKTVETRRRRAYMPSAPLQYTRRKRAPRLAPRHMPELRPGVLGARACASSKGSGSRWSLYRVRSQSRKHTGRR